MANPRHYHGGASGKDVKLPEGKILIPGLIGHATNYVEHPDLVADYIMSTQGWSVARTSSPAPTAASRRGRAMPRGARRWSGPSSGRWPTARPRPASSSGASPGGAEGAACPSRGYQAVWAWPPRSRSGRRGTRALGAVDGDGLARLDGGRAGVGADHGGDAELARYDRRVAEHAAGVGDDGAGHREHRDPGRQRHLAHHDLAVLEGRWPRSAIAHPAVPCERPVPRPP